MLHPGDPSSPPRIPLRKSNREAAGLVGGETLDVEITLDTEQRVRGIAGRR